MIYETIDLYEQLRLPRGGEKGGRVTSFRHADLTEMGQKHIRPALLIIPGGGYGMISQREAEPVAARYFAEGFDCFVLDYAVAPACYPTQLLQAGMAMLWLRRNAQAFSLGKIGVVGFSAGGHLAGCVSYLWSDEALMRAFGEECAAIRPDASVLCYPVVTCVPPTHGDSFRNFCGGKVSPEAYSLEKHVPQDAPPAFLWATTSDDCVPVENALALYNALRRTGVPVEMHLFEEGWHGLSTCDAETNDTPLPAFMARDSAWLPLSVSFLRAHGFVLMSQPRG